MSNKLTTMDVYELCNKHQWFTNGDNEQYERMFQIVSDNDIYANDTDILRMLATIIWICSRPSITQESIYKHLYNKCLENKGVNCFV